MKYGHSWAFIRCCSFSQVFQISWSDFCVFPSCLPLCRACPPHSEMYLSFTLAKKSIFGPQNELFCSSELERTQPPSTSEVPTAIWNMISKININNLALQSKYQFGVFLFFFHSKVANVYFIGILWWFYVWSNKESFDQCLTVSLQRAENVYMT